MLKYVSIIGSAKSMGTIFEERGMKKSPIFEGFILRAMSSFSIPPVFALRSLSVFDHLNSRSVADQLQRLFNNKPSPCLVPPFLPNLIHCTLPRLCLRNELKCVEIVNPIPYSSKNI